MYFQPNFAAIGAVLLSQHAYATGPYHSLGDLFQGQLANLASTPDGNPAIGGQDFGLCCNLAVNQSLEIVNGNVEFTPGQTFLHGNISTFLDYQYPCTAVYNGSQGDQPQVTIPYSWCRDHCNGWARTQTSDPSDWVEPFVAFILPTVVFCFTIPRRRAFVIPMKFFPDGGIFVFPENLTLLYKLPLAACIVLLDTIQWVITCVVMSGPMLLSGVLEVQLDSRIMSYLRSNKHLSPRRQAHLLLVILIGNLDENPAWEHSRKIVGIVDDCDADGKQQGITDNEENLTTKHQFRTIKHQLTSLLEAQTAFGTSVGIGVIFFVSSFIYSVSSIQANYGDPGTAHSLAFGCFWMTIGHIAVVGGVLLAGDNSSTWQAVTADAEESLWATRSQMNKAQLRSNSITDHVRHWSVSSFHNRRLLLPSAFKDTLFRSECSSRYKTAWMWNRGSSKAMWLAKFSEEYKDSSIQADILRIGWIEIIATLGVPAVLLFFIPAFLGGMTSYTTPTIGLSCRSMVPLLYSSCQLILVILWLLDWKLWLRSKDGSVLTMHAVQEARKGHLSVSEMLWYTGFLLALIGALVFAIGGTLFQLMGLFQNCLCWISIWDWSKRYSPGTTMYMGSDSAQQIYYAKRYWMPIGVAATVFLIFTTYVGWQYQHRLRKQFVQLVQRVDQNSDLYGSSNGQSDGKHPHVFTEGIFNDDQNKEVENSSTSNRM